MLAPDPARIQALADTLAAARNTPRCLRFTRKRWSPGEPLTMPPVRLREADPESPAPQLPHRSEVRHAEIR